jgi:hypothetical protein
MDDRVLVRGLQHRQRLVDDVERHVDRQPSAVLLGVALDRLALQQLHDEKGRALLVDVVVLDLDRAGVADLVRDVRFAQEAFAHLFVEGDFVVENFHRADRAVAVRGHVHGSHAAYADERIEPPLATNELADSRSALCDQRIVFHKRSRFPSALP